MPETITLADFQKSIARAVMRPLEKGDAMSRENRPVAGQLIKPNSRLTSSDRLQIYNQQYWWRILGSFAEDFRGLRAVLGERKFNKLADGYLDDQGSRSWSLRDLGSELAGFLERNPDLSAPHHRLAIEMAQVEWARIVAFDGEQKPLLDAQKFVLLEPAKMILGVQPFITLLELHHPIDLLLRKLKRSENNPASNAMSGAVKTRRARLSANLLPEPIHLAVHRMDLAVFYKRLDPEAYHLLSLLRNGATLDSACEQGFASSLEPAEAISTKVQTWFAAWMSFGWLCEK